jgi:Flp pilus assembly protein TadD
MKDKKKIEELIEQGKFYFFNKQYDEALSEFQEALRLDPGNARILYNLGVIYESKEDIEIAKALYLKALELDPKLSEAQKHLDKLVGTSEED